MNLYQRIGLSFTAVVLAATVQAADVSKVAKEACSCLERPYAEGARFMQMAIQAQTSGDMSPLMNAQDEMMQIAREAEVCFQGLAARYPDIANDKSLQEAVMKETDVLCPNPMKQMLKMFGVG